MRTSIEVSPACIKPVKVLSEVSTPALVGTPVGLHYFEAGNHKHVVVNSMRPTYFVVSKVLECLSPFEYPSARFNSVRNLGRSCSCLQAGGRLVEQTSRLFQTTNAELRSAKFLGSGLNRNPDVVLFGSYV
jgi:hypothetical protein